MGRVSKQAQEDVRHAVGRVAGGADELDQLPDDLRRRERLPALRPRVRERRGEVVPRRLPARLDHRRVVVLVVDDPARAGALVLRLAARDEQALPRVVPAPDPLVVLARQADEVEDREVDVRLHELLVQVRLAVLGEPVPEIEFELELCGVAAVQERFEEHRRLGVRRRLFRAELEVSRVPRRSRRTSRRCRRRPAPLDAPASHVASLTYGHLRSA